MSSLPKTIVFSILNLAFLSIVHAEDGTHCSGSDPTCIPNPVESGTFGELITKLALIITEVALPIVILFLIFAGLMFVLARGNPERITRAKEIMWWALIGAALVVGAWAIAIAIENFGEMLSQ